MSTATSTTSTTTAAVRRPWRVSAVDGRVSSIAFVYAATAADARRAAEDLVDERDAEPVWALGYILVTAADGTFEEAWLRPALPACVRCHTRPQVDDAAAYEIDHVRGCYPSDLDDHCEDCLPAGLAALDDAADFEAASDLAVRLSL